MAAARTEAIALMPGGRFDSSLTRVAPVFEQLSRRSDDWVRDFLGLAQHAAGTKTFRDIDLQFVRGDSGNNERRLDPPVSLLSWLIRNLTAPAPGATVTEERRRLLAGDPATIADGLTRLRTASASKVWWVLEGPTCPDVFIETVGALIVIEGKRTENGPTTNTTWMAGRHQMLRHMDGAWEIRGRRPVFGLFVVEGEEPEPLAVPAKWREAAEATVSASALESSFPHRSDAERAAIVEGFLGITTWQRVCQRFGIEFSSLPEVVDAVSVSPSVGADV